MSNHSEIFNIHRLNLQKIQAKKEKIYMIRLDNRPSDD